jgi:hypothetical protein
MIYLTDSQTLVARQMERSPCLLSTARVPRLTALLLVSRSWSRQAHSRLL